MRAKRRRRKKTFYWTKELVGSNDPDKIIEHRIFDFVKKDIEQSYMYEWFQNQVEDPLLTSGGKMVSQRLISSIVQRYNRKKSRGKKARENISIVEEVKRVFPPGVTSIEINQENRMEMSTIINRVWGVA